MQSRRYFISGLVQGVWYRATLQGRALESGFSGYVRNLPDGRVEAAVSCADEPCFERFEQLLWEGSPASVVEDVFSEPLDEIYEGVFEIR